MNLKAENAFWSPDGKADRVLVEFPPPGASTGRSLVILYLRLPPGVSDPAVAALAKERTLAFLAQHVSS